MSGKQRGQDRPAGPPKSLPPLKPRPRFFAALLAALLVWIAFLVTLYFTTVVPRERRQLKPTTAHASMDVTIPAAAPVAPAT